MRWSKVRKLVEESFAPTVKGRVTVHSTTFGACTCGKGAFHVDGEAIAKLNTVVHHSKYRYHFHEDAFPTGHPAIPDTERSRARLVEPGEFSRQDLHRACWTYLHSSISDSIDSGDPLVQSLAVLNAKVGRRRLRRLTSRPMHPLTRRLLELRLEAEAATASQIRVTAVSAGSR